MKSIMRFLQCCVYSLNTMINFRDHSKNEKARKYRSILLIPLGLVRYLMLSLYEHVFFIKKSENIAVVCIVKNEGRYIREFIEYYIGLGCDLIIYDNGSTDDTASIIKEYSEHTHYIYYPGVKRQIDAYNQAIKKYRVRYKYLIVVDADEFLVCDELLNGKSLLTIINEFFDKSKKIACLGINWFIFGSSGYDDFPGGGVLEKFTRCSEDAFDRNRLIKVVVKPERIVGFVDPHLPWVLLGYQAVDLDYHPISYPQIDLPVRRDMRIYHYFCKNKKWFIEKVDRGMADNLRKMIIDYFEYCDRNELENKKAAEI